jgi:D-alanyl-lipoteichoic acid acyltransferase DltB (MBOAT superfamily)
MSITSLSFALFLLITIVLFYLCPMKHRWKVLLAASIVFYAICGVKYLPFILFTSVSVWWGGRRIGYIYREQDAYVANCSDRKKKKEIKAFCRQQAKRVLMLVMIVNLAVLCAVKFLKYAIPSLNSLLAMGGAKGGLTAEMIIVPLGISYYTFSTVGYLLDVYWRRYEYEESLPRFLLYTIYFPHIVQGPISRYNTLGQELKKELRWDYTRVTKGAQLMLWGLFKKLVIADWLNIFVNNVYGGDNQSGLVFLAAILFDAVQIYTDFTGYMDIVTGASQIFGVKLERNFNHPFFAKNVGEFWRRWHMTMGGWFKDYVYYPVNISSWLKNFNKKTKGKLPDAVRKNIVVAIPILITWFLTGLWHGTGVTYVAWGIYYGVLITLSTIFTPALQTLGQKLRINMDAPSFDVYRMVRMFLIFCGGRLLTRPGTLTKTAEVFTTVFRNPQPWTLWDGTLTTFGLSVPMLVLEVLCIVLVWWVSYHEEHCGPVRDTLEKQNLLFRWMLLLGLIFAVIIFGYYGPGFDASAFIYAAY